MLLLAGGVAGIFAGLLGVGGGIVIVPVMELALSVVGVESSIRMHIAVATSLAIIIPTSISSTIAHHKRGAVDLVLVRRWAIFVFVGALLGTWLAAHVHSNVLAGVFAFFSLLVGLKMIFGGKDKALHEAIPRSPLVSVIPTSIGFFSSMMGIGGGTFSVLTLTLFGKPIHQAVGTAALFGLVIAVPGTIGFIVAGWSNEFLPAFSLGFVSLIGLAIIAPMTFFAAPLGAKLAHSMTQRRLNLVFGVFLLVASVRMISRAF